jgi:predicted PurR-regulated permease PerM
MGANEKEYIVKIETKTIVRMILFGFLIALLFVLKDLVLVLLTSIVIASFIESVVNKFKQYKIPRNVVVIVVYLVSLGVMITMFYFFVPVFAEQLSSLIHALGKYIPETSLLNNLQGETVSNTQQLVSGIQDNAPLADIIGDFQRLISGISGSFLQVTSLLFGSVMNVILIAVITFYLSMQDRGIEYFLRIVTPIKHEEYIIGLWKRTERKIGLWFQGQMLLGLLVGLLMYLGLTILGVQYALVIALGVAVLELIPFGIILAIIPSVLFAYADGGMSLSLKVLGLFVIVQQFENYLIAPLIVNKIIGVSPLVVILSILIGAKLAGFWGIILAIPVAVCLLEYLSDIEKGKSVRYTDHPNV